MTKKLETYIEEAMTLLRVLRIKNESVSCQRHDSIVALKQDKVNQKPFENAIKYDRFQKAFGWDIANVDGYFFMVKKVAGEVIFIEVELRIPEVA